MKNFESFVNSKWYLVIFNALAILVSFQCIFRAENVSETAIILTGVFILAIAVMHTSAIMALNISKRQTKKDFID